MKVIGGLRVVFCVVSKSFRWISGNFLKLHRIKESYRALKKATRGFRRLHGTLKEVHGGLKGFF